MSHSHSIELQSLEGRLLFANAALAVALEAGILRVSGTSDADTIAISRSGSTWKISNGTWNRAIKGAADSLFIKAGAGNDSVKIDPSVFTPARVFANSGNDTVIAGSGNDSIYGHAGEDSLAGGDGNDLLVSIGGTLRDTLIGGGGEDSFWLDAGGSETIGDLSSSESRNAATHRIGAFQSLRGQAISKEITGERTRLPDPISAHRGGNWNNFSSIPLFATGGPAMDDVEQGSLGDCYIHAPLASVAAGNSRRIRETIADLGDGTFAVRLQRGERINFYRIDADLPVYSWSSNTPVYAGFGTRNATWAPLIEKAMAFHRSGAGSYTSLDNGGWFDEMYSALGVSSNDRWPDEFTSAKNMLATIEAELAHGKVVTIATRQMSEAAGSMLVGGHAYTVVRVIRNADGSRSAVLRNPWAVDGGSVPSGRADDGYLTISAAQLKLATLAFTTAQA